MRESSAMVSTRSAFGTTWLMVISKTLCRLKMWTLRLSVEGASPVLEVLRPRDGVELVVAGTEAEVRQGNLQRAVPVRAKPAPVAFSMLMSSVSSGARQFSSPPGVCGGASVRRKQPKPGGDAPVVATRRRRPAENP